jgi:hypothetical protein
MAEDWFVEKAGANSWDEWSFTIAQGDNAAKTLQVSDPSFLFTHTALLLLTHFPLPSLVFL